MMEFDKKLFAAVKRGSLPELKKCITKDSDVNAVNDQGEKLIHVAAKNGRKNIIVYLIEEHGVDVNDLDQQGCTPLYHAAKCGHANTLMRLIDIHSADFNKANKNGVSPLHVAASEGYLEIVKFLIGKGVGVDDTDGHGWTPLHYAAGGRNCLETMKFLVEEGAVANIENASGRAPIHIAAINGCNDNIGFLLTDDKVNINDVDKEGHTALYHAAWNGWGRTMSFLVEKGAVDTDIDISVRDLTLLDYALRANYLEIVEFFVGRGIVGFDHPDAQFRTLLCRVAERGNLEVAKLITNKANNANEKVDDTDEIVKIARYLLDQGADIDFRDGDHNTPLSIAIQARNMQSSSLMDCSATKSPPCGSQDVTDKIFDFNETNRDSQTLSRFSTEESSSAMQIPPCAPSHGGTIRVSDLTAALGNLSMSGDDSTIRVADLTAALGNLSMSGDDSTIRVADLKAALDNLSISGASGTSSNITGEDGHIESVSTLRDSRTQSFTYTSMCDTIKNSKLKEIKLFKCESTVINEVDENGNTLLHIAAEIGNVGIIKHLVKIGFSLDARNSDDDIPLCVAIKNSRSNAAAELAKESDIGYENSKDKKQLLHLAVENGNSTMVRMLLSRGANCDAIDIDGNKPLDLNKSGRNAGTIRNLFLTHNKQQSKVNDVEGQQVRSKFDSYLDNTPTSAGSSTQASASGFTNISEGAKITSSSSKPSSTFGGAMQKQNLGDSQQNVLKVEGLDKDKIVPESSHSSFGRSLRGKVRAFDPVKPPSTFCEREEERRNIRKTGGSLQQPTHAASRNRSAESYPNPGDERRWRERVKPEGEESKATPSVRRGNK